MLFKKHILLIKTSVDIIDKRNDNFPILNHPMTNKVIVSFVKYAKKCHNSHL